MGKILWITVGVSAVGLVLGVCTYAIPEFVCVLLALPFFVAQVGLFFVLLGYGITLGRKASRLWFVPALVCLMFLLCRYYFASPIGQRISDWRFGKHVAEYSRVVDGFRGGSIECQKTCDAEFEDIVESTKTPTNATRLAGIGLVWGERCDDGTSAMLFLLDTDVPLMHEGYIFKGYGEKSNCNAGPEKPEKRWYIRHITGPWYHFSDQPGL